MTDSGIVVDAALLSELLAVAAADVPSLMRIRAITSICERGMAAHQGEYRLSFFYRNRRARLSIDGSGRILRRSVVDFGQSAMPRTRRRPEGPATPRTGAVRGRSRS
jgi:hypothetical protein